jgi:hypothetical protein
MAAKPQDLPGVEGPGVSIPKFKDLDKLGDKFIDLRDEKAALAGKMTKLEDQIVELMRDHDITRYVFGDQEMVLKEGKVHVRVKTVKVGGGATDDPDDE